MSVVAITALGKLHRVSAESPYILEMPCGEYERLDERQFAGTLSVNHSLVCPHACGYHETHDFAAAVEAAGGWTVE